MSWGHGTTQRAVLAELRPATSVDRYSRPAADALRPQL